jgi:hypothetical protein
MSRMYTQLRTCIVVDPDELLPPELLVLMFFCGLKSIVAVH